MSDLLIEKVAKAIQHAPQGDYLMDWEPEARAAILAVAEWLEHRSLDWPDNAEGKIAAALRAELERLRGEK